MGEDPVIQAIKRDIEELLVTKRTVTSGFSAAADLGANGQGVMEEIRWALNRAAEKAQVDMNRIPVRSLRPFWSPFITFFKRAVRKSTYWLYQPLFQQITNFNIAILDCLDRIALRLEEADRATQRPVLEENVAALQETQRQLAQKIELLEKAFQEWDAKTKQVLTEVATDKADLQREVIEAKQQVQDTLRELASLRRLVEDYRAEAAFLRAKLALALQYQRTGRWPVPQEEEGPGHALRPLQDPADTTWLYHAFEQQFRGPEELIKERQRAYLPDVQKAHEACGGYLLDLGAGRGEFLELCREAGIPAKGVDLNEAMISRCQEKGLEVERAEAISYLQSLPDESLCAVTAFQLVEHLAPSELWHLVQTALVKLKPGGVIILETVNPHSLAALQNFYLDLTHQRPIPAPTLRFLLEAAGFRRVAVRFSSPVPEALCLQGDDLNVAKLNDLLFGYQDYAVVGWR
ncbi:class I SAM-dependent methyltransferase [Desulfofundulus thermosubterraneus]|uniref:Methyltransferase domain-containing protein n=1 Tax=Desulfofundulus thermosubterraneus DSM 16057 TaxID=1121432 RepID=A0A1M6FTA7_9FIRM|nr:class I SAM-dependent methyltransferase [Desulfofundulus thermosubterraneus]SHJ00928.1 Methyltransferase domain-containing protein [Desulfofundulus thermosubterraneus DSM 16057]